MEGNRHGLVYESGDAVWVLDTSQGIKEPLLRRAGLNANFALALSSDLTQVAYSTDRYNLWIASATGSNAKKILADQLLQVGLAISSILWSPSGEKLAVMAAPAKDPQSNPGKVTLYIVDLPTDSIREIATGVTALAWTTAGNQLVVIKQFDPEQGPGIYLVSIDGSDSKQIFEGLAEPYIAVSPRGGKAAFVAGRRGNASESSLFEADLSSAEVVDLLQGSELHFQSIGNLAWSTDGGHLAFIAAIPQKDNLAVSTLFVIDLQTQALREVAQGVRGPLTWSPSSDEIATTLMSSTEGIYRVNVESGGFRKLTDDRLSVPTSLLWR